MWPGNQHLRLTCIGIIFLTLFGCDYLREISSNETPAKPIQATPTQPPSKNQWLPAKSVQLSQAYLSQRNMIPLSGPDLRPTWKVEGRLTNSSGYTISRVRLSISLNDPSDHSQVDGAEIDLKIEIPPTETRGFSQEVRLLPPVNNHKIEWTYDILLVEGHL